MATPHETEIHTPLDPLPGFELSDRPEGPAHIMSSSDPDNTAAAVPAPRSEYTGDRTGYLAMERDPRFVELRSAQRAFIFPVTAAFLAWFLLYVGMSAYARDFMATEITDHVNVALVFGLLQFVSTFVIAWAYSRFARNRLDPVSTELRKELEA